MAFCASLPLRTASRHRVARPVRRNVCMQAAPVATGERMLHAVYRVGNLERTHKFLEALGMQLLRSRDMAAEKYANAFYGYGSESRGSHFALELTYNYGVDTYKVGNAFDHFSIAASDVKATVSRIRDAGFQVQQIDGDCARATDPTGYAFQVVQENRRDSLRAMRFNVVDLQRSTRFYSALGMTVQQDDSGIATVAFGSLADSTALELVQCDGTLDAGDGYAQIAVSTPSVYEIADRMRAGGVAITRDPGPVPGIGTKICAVRDPDGFKIVFVDEDDFEKELE